MSKEMNQWKNAKTEVIIGGIVTLASVAGAIAKALNGKNNGNNDNDQEVVFKTKNYTVTKNGENK